MISRQCSTLVLIAGLVLAAITLTARFAPVLVDPPWITPTDRYEPSLRHLQTVDEIVAMARANARDPSIKEQVYQLEQIVRLRFYGGYSRYTFGENWMAWLAARLFFANLDAKVLPGDILRHRAAACSQQAIVVQAALARMGLRYATAELPSHFFATAWIDSEWYIVDPWGPLDRDRSKLQPFETITTEAGRDKLFTSTQSRAFAANLRLEPARIVKIDTFPAKNVRLFHQVTGWASHWLWAVFIVAALALRSRRLRFSARAAVPGDDAPGSRRAEGVGYGVSPVTAKVP